MKTVLVLFGGMSTEHEVSIVTALQVMNALKEANFKVIPGYISKGGEWYLGDGKFLEPDFYKDLNKVKKASTSFVLPADRKITPLVLGWLGYGGINETVDVIFPVFHGRNGEDGSIQGVLELSGLPYVGCKVTASALGMDKYLAKKVAKDIGMNVVRDVLATKHDWEVNRKKVMKQINKLGEKVIIKPNDLGSSIGIAKTETNRELEQALEVAFVYADRVLVEELLNNPMELNVSVLGNGPYKVSEIEQPLRTGETLTFEDKYIREEGKTKGMAGAKRLIPAPIKAELTNEVKNFAKLFFETIGGKGIARVDFMVDKKGTLYFNEINTMPGSLAFYLWEATGIGFTSLVKELVNLAEEELANRNGLISVFESNILTHFAKGAGKGKS